MSPLDVAEEIGRLRAHTYSVELTVRLRIEQLRFGQAVAERAALGRALEHLGAALASVTMAQDEYGPFEAAAMHIPKVSED